MSRMTTASSGSGPPCDCVRAVSALVLARSSADPDIRCTVEALQGIAETTVAAGHEIAPLAARLAPDLVVADDGLAPTSDTLLADVAARWPAAVRILLRSAPVTGPVPAHD